MIGTASETSNNAKYILYTDDINNKNIAKLADFYNSANLVIDKKFELPSSKEELNMNNVNETTRKLLNNIKEAIIDKFNSGDSQIVTNQTQLDNLVSKLHYWTTVLFKGVIDDLDKGQKQVKVFIHNNTSKHENIMIKLLYNVGVTFIIVTNNRSVIDNIDNAVYEWQNTSENLDIKSYRTNSSTELVSSTNSSNINDLDDIIPALNSNENCIKIILSGIDDREKALDIYRELYSYSNSRNDVGWYTIQKFTEYNEEAMSLYSRIPANKMSNIQYIVGTLKMFLSKKADISAEQLGKEIEQYMQSASTSNCVNDIVHAIVIYNKLVEKDEKILVFYGKLNKYIGLTLTMLGYSRSRHVVVLSSDKGKTLALDSIHKMELENSVEYFDMKNISYLGAVKTQAASVEKEVNRQFFSGDTLGMYKPGQLTGCNTTRFSTTYSELSIWWTTEMYTRPGFRSDNNIATVPTMFKVISGVDKDPKEFKKFIMSMCVGKTILYNSITSLNDNKCISNSESNYSNIIRATDMNRTSFSAQKKFFENCKLNRSRVTNGVNYKYSIISDNKQELIFKNLEDIINNKLIKYESFGLSYDEYVDAVLNVGLNLNKTVLQYIHWFEFFTESPKVVLVVNDEARMDIKDIIYLVLMSLCGFDTIIFVPTRYNSIENKLADAMMVDYHVIGEACYNIDVTDMRYTEGDKVGKQNNNKGIFSKLFRQKGK